MLSTEDNLALAADAIRAHKLRASLTVLGLTMGVATLITVMTLVQGANSYVEQKIANLGTNVFKIARTPFAVTDFALVIKALRYKYIEFEDLDAVSRGCIHCEQTGASVSNTLNLHFRDKELQDTNLFGHTPNMASVDTRTLALGRYFTDIEDRHSSPVCLIGDRVAQDFFGGVDPLGRTLRAANEELTVIGTFERIGSVLGQDQDNFIVVPLRTFLKMRG